MTVLLEYIDNFNLSGNISNKHPSLTLTEETPFHELLQYHRSPIQRITILAHVQIITMRALGSDCAIRILFTYYAGILLDAFLYLLCSKLCWHNWLRPSQASLLPINKSFLSFNTNQKPHIKPPKSGTKLYRGFTRPRNQLNVNVGSFHGTRSRVATILYSTNHE